MNNDTRNTVLFIVLSCAVIFGYEKFFGTNNPEVTVQQNVINSTANQTNTVSVISEEEDKVKETPVNISIKSDKISGSMSSKGSSINDITLLEYKATLDEDSKNVKLLYKNTEDKYSTEIGWKTNSQIKVPTNKTVWRVTSGHELTPDTPVEMVYKNKQGFEFKKTYTMDKDYVITITQSVKNNSKMAASLKPYARISKTLPKAAGSWQTAYEGPIGVFNGKAEEIEYSKIDDKKNITFNSKGGWVGITEKYWLVSFIPSQDQQVNSVFHKLGNKYMVDMYHDEIIVNPGETVSTTQRLFAGAKDINILDMYESKFNVKNFDLAIDFGYLYFLTKPLLYILAFTQDHIGNLGLGILLLTVILKLLLFPLANKSYRSMNRMRDVQPKIKAIQDRYANDRIKMGQELSELYKREKINPTGGCLPMFLQMPILFALYKVLYISIDMRHAPFYGWIHDLSAPDQMYILNLFGLIPVDLPGFLQIGIWPIIMGLSMLLQQKMSPQVGDQAQAKMMMIVMPVMFTWMFAGLPSGLVIYWTWSNLLGIIQQYAIMKSDRAVTVKEKK